MKLTGYKVYRNGELLFDNVDIEIPDIAGFHPIADQKTREQELIVDGKDIRKGAIDV